MTLDPRDHEDLFQKHTPPPGGLARLRARLGQEGRRSGRRRAFVVGLSAAALAAAVALILLWVGYPRPLPDAPDNGQAVLQQLSEQSLAHPTLVSLGLATPSLEPVTLATAEASSTALLRVPVADDRVVMYLVSGL